jgi:hypothetical protein
MIQNLVIQLPHEWRIVFTVVYFVLFGILLGCSIYLTFRYQVFLMYIPTVIYLLGGFVFIFCLLGIKYMIKNIKTKITAHNRSV